MEDEPVDPAVPDPQADPVVTTEPVTDWEAEAEKWKSQSRKHEDRAKANAAAARELESVRKANQTDTEKAVSDAEERGRRAALAQSSQRLAAAEIRAALTGIEDDPAGFVDDLNLAKYLTEDGEVDVEKVAALKARREAAQKVKPKRFEGSADGGSRGGDGGKPKQLTQADLKSMTPEAIVAARANGQLADAMGGKT